MDDVEQAARVHFAHAALQRLAQDHDVPVLHFKGPAAESALALHRGTSSDADVLVHPDHVERFMRELKGAGWAQLDTFMTGSAQGHASTFRHPVWGYADIHRLIPGIGSSSQVAFDRLWKRRVTRDIAGIPCAMPSDDDHRLILLLCAARAPHAPRAARDIELLWSDADTGRRTTITRLVDEFGAGTAFSVITGHLEDHRDDPSYPMWAVAAYGSTRTGEWWARIRTAPTLRGKLALAGRALLVNTDHLTMLHGRPPTRGEVAREFVRRIGLAAHEIRQAITGRRQGAARR